jgi:hypothetical protein
MGKGNDHSPYRRLGKRPRINNMGNSSVNRVIYLMSWICKHRWML